jgi:ABC-type sugar transport system substrate-binding protein
MKKMLIALVLVLLLALMVSTVAFAAAGGVPAVHGVDGRTFGGLVSGLAQIDPLALVAHVSGR